MQPEVAIALTEASHLLLIGMVAVFLFVSMLIDAITLITLIAWINRLISDEALNPTETQTKFFNSTLPNNQSVPPKIVAAISSAIYQYRK
jgi:oxaloacetate decarboxylase gamma subunit